MFKSIPCPAYKTVLDIPWTTYGLDETYKGNHDLGLLGKGYVNGNLLFKWPVVLRDRQRATLAFRSWTTSTRRHPPSTMRIVLRIIESVIQDNSEVRRTTASTPSKSLTNHRLEPAARMAIRKMMSRYWRTSPPLPSIWAARPPSGHLHRQNGQIRLAAQPPRQQQP